MGTSDDLPLAPIWSTATARGPRSFFAGVFRSRGTISGRFWSWACAQMLMQSRDASRVATACRRFPRCKIFVNPQARAVEFELGGEICMKVNDKAPDFTLQDESGNEMALKDLRGKTVVLYFYPRADTPG